MISYELASEIKAKYQNDLLTKENVVGVGIGKKSETGEFCIRVYVEVKKPENQLKSVDIIPKLIEGVKTDVVESGKLLAQNSG
jgi:hypothetical protein